jgi:hypothetical protein
VHVPLVAVSGTCVSLCVSKLYMYVGLVMFALSPPLQLGGSDSWSSVYVNLSYLSEVMYNLNIQHIHTRACTHTMHTRTYAHTKYTHAHTGTGTNTKHMQQTLPYGSCSMQVHIKICV